MKVVSGVAVVGVAILFSCTHTEKIAPRADESVLGAKVSVLSDAPSISAFALSDRTPQMASARLEQLIECAHRAPKCNVEIRLFQEIARLYRAPGEEKALVEFMIALAKGANAKIWNGRLRWTIDDANNFMILVPATGEFAARKTRPIALQAHMDMVLMKADAQPGEDLKPYFKANPVLMEEKDGWLRSKDEYTTLGADNGIGVAMQLRYLLESRTPHPPLELVFTSGEEAGLKGAMKMSLPIEAAVMLNLDGVKLKEVVAPNDGGLMLIYGCQGARRFKVSSARPGWPVSRGAEALRFKIAKGLLGGHSGLTIHLDRVNTVKLAGQIFEALAKQGLSDLVLVSAAAGDPSFPNKVPSTIELVFSSSDSETLSKAQRVIADRVRQAIVAARDDERNLSKIGLELSRFRIPESTLGLSFSDFTALGDAIDLAPNRVIFADENYPLKSRTTSNIGSFLVRANLQTRLVDVSNVVMTRSYVSRELQVASERIAQTLLRAHPPRSGLVQLISEYPPWLSDPNHWLIRLAKAKVRDFSGQSIMPAGIEPGPIGELYKRNNLQLVSLGLDIWDAHTVKEKVRMTSVTQLTQAVEHLLREIPKAPQFGK